MNRLSKFSLCLGAWLIHASAAHATIRYASEQGGGNCLSWETACALTTAIDNSVEGDEVWVKTGTYAAITLKSGVKIIGGFASGETAASQSNPTANPTILDGGGSGPVVTSENNSPQTTVLRGFRITDGHGAAPLTSEVAGGGMYLFNSSAVIVQCIFDNNTATYNGAAVGIHGGSPWFVNCVFRDNGTGTAGAGADPAAAPWAGGAVFVHSGSPTFMNCLFYNNKAAEGGAIQIFNGTPEIVNCTFVKNRAKEGYGGALSDQGGQAKVRNCVFWDNSGSKGAHQIFTSVLAEGDVSYSVIQGGFAGTSISTADPLFINAAADNYRLASNSPCLNAGKHAAPALPTDQGDLNWNGNLGEPTPLDLDGLTRRVNLKVDLGAYERPTGTLPPGYE